MITSKATREDPTGLRPSGYDPERSRCENCLFYRPAISRGWNDEPVSWQGECKRYPPIITGQYRTLPDNSRTQRLGSFPMVESGWSCGEFRLAIAIETQSATTAGRGPKDESAG